MVKKSKGNKKSKITKAQAANSNKGKYKQASKSKAPCRSASKTSKLRSCTVDGSTIPSLNPIALTDTEVANNGNV
ncbi:MAG: hypothetical protein HQK97_12240 [Nitrospirae bacterium]|nr:hypothetical protein [Nitrospirota bacterium]